MVSLHFAAMTDLISKLSEITPDVRTDGAAKRYRWGDVLAVIILPNGEIGQFASGGSARSREDIEEAVRSMVR